MFAPRRTRRSSIVMVDSRELLRILLERNLTTTDASREAGVSHDIIGKLIRANRHVTLRTAGRLKAAFGDSVIIIDNGKE